MESSLITIIQNTFLSDLNQLIADIRIQLSTHIHYKTTTSVIPTLNGIPFLNSNKIIFNDVRMLNINILIFRLQQGEYVMAERIVTSSQGNNFDVHIFDNITWKRITLTF
ncbi:unnamed protein product [Adineta steineri]|uniref:Uncharacterized protein n=1 Tax=Adineta steineri TaxID=433720 RepID=A0A820B7P1_9BILA|nr:unnamed protein product [Adineta steineri]CAF4202935.1 unnamed protein product [Adineta steineri]